jgi:hypothetical protein
MEKPCICYALAGAGRAAELHLDALRRFSPAGGGGRISDTRKFWGEIPNALRKNKNAMVLKK